MICLIIIEYIELQNKKLESSRICGMIEIKEYWSELVRDKEAEHKDRLKAAEYIAKTNGAFLDKVEHSGEVGLSITVNKK